MPEHPQRTMFRADVRWTAPSDRDGKPQIIVEEVTVTFRPKTVVTRRGHYESVGRRSDLRRWCIGETRLEALALLLAKWRREAHAARVWIRNEEAAAAALTEEVSRGEGL